MPPIVAVADEGWSITDRAELDDCPECFHGGTHGYDPALESMGGILVGWGPGFASGVRSGPIENIHLYELMCALLGLRPAENSGSAAATAELRSGG